MRKTKLASLFAVAMVAVFFLSGCISNQSETQKSKPAPSEKTEKVQGEKAVAPKKAAVVNITKSEKPKVEIFVMSYCPYGTQMQKGVSSVIETLSKKADISIKFVDYIMHGEKETNENLSQYCIQKEQPEKFLDYMNCFLKEGKTDECFVSEKIQASEVEACVAGAKKEFDITNKTENGARYPAFGVHEKENEQYDIKGSPTLVVNGQVVKSGRDSASLLATICSAFETQPEECDAELSSATPSPGFGTGSSGATSAGGCGG